MNNLEEILDNQKYKKIIDNLSSEVIEKILIDDIKALEAAKKGVEQIEPEKANDVEYVQAVAYGMQNLARIILDSRK